MHPVNGPREVFAELSEAWQICVQQAWVSWSTGSAGVGAAVLDPEGRIIAVGRNRMLDRRAPENGLAGSPLAHAGMVAVAQLPLGNYSDHELYTTFEPCLMCAATILQLGVGRVRYAAADPVFDGLHDWLAQFDFTAHRIPEHDCLGGPIGAFCHVLHLSWLAFWVREGGILDAHHRLAPRHLELAQQLTEDGHLERIAREGGSVQDALAALWPELQSLT